MFIWTTISNLTILCALCACIAAQRFNYPELIRAINVIRQRPRVEKKSDSDEQHNLDLRGPRIFDSSPHADCCPTISHLTEKRNAVDPHGVMLDLYHTQNFTQKFYETVCHSDYEDETCQFIATRYRAGAKCRQQYSYVYALGRTHGNANEDYKITYVRVKSGCKCVVTDTLRAIKNTRRLTSK